MSPFQVNTDQDTGFVPTTSLAGGRLATALADTPVAYSVLTRDFIDALDLTNLSDMAQWMPNSSERSEDGSLEWSRNDYYLSSRGIAANRPQRDFFPYAFNFDSYNIERLDFGRGPNSILFGSSGYGGTPSALSKRARTDKTFGDVRLTYGSWGSLRSTIDENVAPRQDWAVRVNGLYADMHGWQTGDFEKKKAATIAATWRPLQHTEVRFEGEKGSKDKAAVAATFLDFLSAWNGATTYSAPISAAVPAAGINRQTTRTLVFTPTSGNDTVVNYEGWARTEGGNLTAAYPAGGTLVKGPSAGIRGEPILNQVNLPADLYRLAASGSTFQTPSRDAAFAVDSPLYTERYYNYTLALTQQFGSHVFAEIAGNVANLDKVGDLGTSRGFNQLYIDVNRVLPSGASNPNFLQPYQEGRAYPRYLSSLVRNGRLSLAYVLDDTKWGSFRFNALAGMSRSRDSSAIFVYALKDNPDHRQWPTYDQVRFRYYYSDQSRPYDLSTRTWQYVNPVSKTTQSAEGGLIRDVSGANSSEGGTNYDYGQVAATAKLLRNRLVLLGALRRDQYKTFSRSNIAQFDHPLDWNGRDLLLRPDAPADWGSLTYRARNAAGQPYGPELPATTRPRKAGSRDPLYAGDRFQDDYSSPTIDGGFTTFSEGAVLHVTKKVSAFVNFAESFVPPTGQQDFSGQLFRAHTAKGWDFGLRGSFLHDHLAVSLTRYQGEDDNNIISAATYRNLLTTIISAPPVGELDPGAINARNVGPLPGGTIDYIKSKVSGYEFEVTANLSSSWRLMLNGALAQGRQADSYPLLRSYLAVNGAKLRQIVQDAGGIFSGDDATFNPAIPVSSSPNGPGAVNAWNSLQDNLSSINTADQKLLRLVEATANVFTDYTIRTGRFKGLRFGAGVNYRGRQAIGFRGADTIVNPADPTKAVDDPSVDATTAVYAPGYATTTIVVGYTHRINSALTLELNFRVDNACDYSKPVYYDTALRPLNGDLTSPARVTTPSNYYWVKPRNFSVTAEIKF